MGNFLVVTTRDGYSEEARRLFQELVTGNNSWLRRAKLNPTPETEKRFLGEIQRALDLEQARLGLNPNDTAALYAMGITYGLRANYFFLVKKAWRDSLRDATTARKLHNRVSELDPSNVDARLVQGLHDYIVGSPLCPRTMPMPLAQVKGLDATPGANSVNSNRPESARLSSLPHRNR